MSKDLEEFNEFVGKAGNLIGYTIVVAIACTALGIWIGSLDRLW